LPHVGYIDGEGEMSDRKMSDRKMSDREMSDREMSDREMNVPFSRCERIGM
jgi:hypothetical protein